MAERISLAHGDGGELAHRLIADVFVRAFGKGKGNGNLGHLG